MSDFLDEMASASLSRARTLKESTDPRRLETLSRLAPAPMQVDFTAPGFDLIAEAKLASPSQGRLIEGSGKTVVSLARDFQDRGAAIVSVLTEETRFAGSLHHLELTSAALEIPVMRKDFLVDPAQVLEARVSGASGLLLIARLLPGGLLTEMTDLALGLGMFVLVEVFDRSDLETAVRVFDREVLVGVNCRDLATLEVDLGRFQSLAPHLPDHLPAVAESGLSSAADVAMVARLGYRLALIGSSLVSADDPAANLAGLLSAGRQAWGVSA